MTFLIFFFNFKNLMKTTFLFTIRPKPNQYPLSKSQFFWNRVSLPQTCPCLPLQQTPDIFLNPNLPHVLFVLIQWMSLCRQLILIQVLFHHTQTSDRFLWSLLLSYLWLIALPLQSLPWVLILYSHEPKPASSKRAT